MACLHYEYFLGKKVIAFSSDARLDFMKGDPASPQRFKMTDGQQSLLNSLGVKNGVIFPKQVHGDAIWEVTDKDINQAGIHEADAVITTMPGLAIAVRTADCLPLLLFAPVKRVIAAVHAGWKSTRLDIAAKTVALMKKKYGVDPVEIKAAIGPCIRPASYPVGADFKEFFPREVAERDGCLYFDIAAANCRQLLGEGVPAHNIVDCGCDTYSDKSWHSFRRDTETSGRMIHVIMLKGQD